MKSPVRSCISTTESCSDLSHSKLSPTSFSSATARSQQRVPLPLPVPIPRCHLSALDDTATSTPSVQATRRGVQAQSPQPQPHPLRHQTQRPGCTVARHAASSHTLTRQACVALHGTPADWGLRAPERRVPGARATRPRFTDAAAVLGVPPRWWPGAVSLAALGVLVARWAPSASRSRPQRGACRMYVHLCCGQMRQRRVCRRCDIMRTLRRSSSPHAAHACLTHMQAGAQAGCTAAAAAAAAAPARPPPRPIPRPRLSQRACRGIRAQRQGTHVRQRGGGRDAARTHANML
jgi:hypothetical protein